MQTAFDIPGWHHRCLIWRGRREQLGGQIADGKGRALAPRFGAPSTKYRPTKPVAPVINTCFEGSWRIRPNFAGPWQNRTHRTDFGAPSQQPGVYQYFDVDRRLLYVGKAKLKARLELLHQAHDNGKTWLLVSKIRHPVAHRAIRSRCFAAGEQPHQRAQAVLQYPAQGRQDLSIHVIKKERFPCIFATRQLIRDGSEYLGPSPASRSCTPFWTCAANLPIRTCALALSEENIANGKFRVCLEYHIGNCKGPAWASSRGSLRRQHRGHPPRLARTLGRSRAQPASRWVESAEAFLFEEAEQYKQAGRQKVPGQKHHRPHGHHGSRGVLHRARRTVRLRQLSEDPERNDHQLHWRCGANSARTPRKSLKPRLCRCATNLAATPTPPRLRNRFAARGGPAPRTGAGTSCAWWKCLSATRGFSCATGKNKWSKPEAATQRLLESAKEDLRLTELPVHIECFDNSNIQGTNPASACVVFKNGKPAKSDYRKFNIRTVDGPDDFASMTEVVHRRYHRLLTEGEPCLSSSSSTAEKGNLARIEALEGLGLRGKIAIIGIAKRLEEIYYPGDQHPLYLDKRSSTLKLIQHSATRPPVFIGASPQAPQQGRAPFRVGRHRRRRVQTRHALLAHFKTVDAIRQADETALLDVANSGRQGHPGPFRRAQGSKRSGSGDWLGGTKPPDAVTGDVLVDHIQTAVQGQRQCASEASAKSGHARAITARPRIQRLWRLLPKPPGAQRWGSNFQERIPWPSPLGAVQNAHPHRYGSTASTAHRTAHRPRQKIQSYPMEPGPSMPRVRAEYPSTSSVMTSAAGLTA